MRIASPLTTEPNPVLQWIEVASSLQLPSFHVIGLASPEVAEARERVRAAIESSDYEFPRRRVVINLSPASIRKRGTGADLAMAIGILWAASEAPSRFPGGMVASGELGLDGRVKPVGQVMRTLHAAWEAGAEVIFLSQEDHALALRYLPLLGRTGIFSRRPPALIPVASLVEAWEIVEGKREPEYQSESAYPPLPSLDRNGESQDLLPLSPEMGKWIRIAAAGLHHLLLLGPRGAGKSHAFEWLIRLQPRASAETQVRQLLIRELLGSDWERLEEGPPVRRVGTMVRAPALCGGTSHGALKPGEFSLAHGGVLVADELPEWSRDSREALREPLERGKVTLTRTQATAELPARFVLAANGNLCPCGGWPRLLRKGHARSPSQFSSPCICKDAEVSAYLKRLSGPILDRIDIIQLVSAGRFESVTSEGSSEAFRILRDRTAHAQELASKAWGSPPGLLGSAEVEALLREHPDWRKNLDHRANLGMRSRHKMVRVALSLAIYENVETGGSRLDSVVPQMRHFEEAFYLRPEGINLHMTSEELA